MKTNNEETVALYKIENKKDCKYGEEILEKYSRGTLNESKVAKVFSNSLKKREEYTGVIVNVKYLEDLVKLAKGSKTEYIELTMGDNPLGEGKLLVSMFIDDMREFNGSMIIAEFSLDKEDRKMYEIEKQEEIVALRL